MTDEDADTWRNGFGVFSDKVTTIALVVIENVSNAWIPTSRLNSAEQLHSMPVNRLTEPVASVSRLRDAFFASVLVSSPRFTSFERYRNSMPPIYYQTVERTQFLLFGKSGQ